MPDNAAPVLILTRPEDANARFQGELGDSAPELMRGVTVVISPIIRIHPLTPDLPPGRPAALILTSVHGAEAAARLGLTGLRAWVVGERTAEVAREMGLEPHPSEYDAERLVAKMIALGVEGPLLHLRGEHQRGDVAPRLDAAGISARALVTYRQEGLTLSQEALAHLNGPRPVVLPFFSPRSAALVAAQGPFAAPLHVAAMSDAVAEEAQALAPASMSVAETPDSIGMIEATTAALLAATG